MLHYEFQSVSRMMENITYGLTGRDWKPINDLCNKSLRNGESDDNTQSEIRRQSFTLLIYLAQILENSIKQYIELKNIIANGKDQLELVRDINRGINNSLNLARTVYPNIDAGIYKDWNNVNTALMKLENIYGVAADSPDIKIQTDTDRNVAEAVTMNNDIYKYTQNIDELGEAIKDFSHEVSPGGAQKLTAQTLGVMLQVMNQSLRTQATGLKLQAQSIAVSNKKEKDSTKQYLETANTLRVAMKKEQIHFSAPRF